MLLGCSVPIGCSAACPILPLSGEFTTTDPKQKRQRLWLVRPLLRAAGAGQPHAPTAQVKCTVSGPHLEKDGSSTCPSRSETKTATARIGVVYPERFVLWGFWIEVVPVTIHFFWSCEYGGGQILRCRALGLQYAQCASKVASSLLALQRHSVPYAKLSISPSFLSFWLAH